MGTCFLLCDILMMKTERIVPKATIRMLIQQYRPGNREKRERREREVIISKQYCVKPWHIREVRK